MNREMWQANCREPDAICLAVWKARFSFKGDSEKYWKQVYSIIRRNSPVQESEEFISDVHFAVWGFRNDYALEKGRDVVIGYRKTQNAEAKKIASAAIAALDRLTQIGADFAELAAPVREALIEYSNEGPAPVRKINGRKPEKARDLLVLTLADRWEHYTRLIPVGEQWNTFATLVLNASGYTPNNKRGDGESYSEPHKLLPNAQRKYSVEKLYLRGGTRARSAYVFAVIKGIK